MAMPRTIKPLFGDRDHLALGIRDYYRFVGYTDDIAFLMAATIDGISVEPDKVNAKKFHEYSQDGWICRSLYLRRNRDYVISRLMKKERRKRSPKDMGHRARVAAAVQILFSPVLDPARRAADLPFLLTKRENELLFSWFKDITSPPDPNNKIPAPARKKSNAERMRDKRATNGAQTRTKNHEREKPWLKLGISRRTWYRKGKPVPRLEI
jgi:hypothetical protein